MIVQAFLNFIGTSLAGWLSVMPAVPPDLLSTLQALPGQIQTVVNDVSMLGPILPLPQIGLALGIVLYAIAVAFIIAVVRKVISVVTGGGL